MLVLVNLVDFVFYGSVARYIVYSTKFCQNVFFNQFSLEIINVCFGSKFSSFFFMFHSNDIDIHVKYNSFQSNRYGTLFDCGTMHY